MAKADWVKIKSETLKQEIAYDKNSGWVFCRDGTKYSPEELNLFSQNHCELPLLVHLVKKEFQGTVVAVPNGGK